MSDNPDFKAGEALEDEILEAEILEEELPEEGEPETVLPADDAEVSSDDEAEDIDTLAELAERTEDLQRITAEYANYRRRTERERATTIELAQVAVVTDLLPVLDDLELAAQHGDLEKGPLKSISEKIHAALVRLKVEEFGAVGDSFDPERHEAVQDLSSGDEKVVGTVLRRGYQLGDRLVRTAMVIIADPS